MVLAGGSLQHSAQPIRMGLLHKDVQTGVSFDRPIHGSRHTLGGFVHTPCASLPMFSEVRTDALVAFQTARPAIGLRLIAGVLASVGLANIECEACFPKLPFLELSQYMY